MNKKHQAYALAVGSGFLYLIFVLLLGTRPLVLISGGSILLLVNCDLLWRGLKTTLSSDRDNLLIQKNFNRHAQDIFQALELNKQPELIVLIQEAYCLCQIITKLDPTLIPQMLETIHQMLFQARQTIEAIVILNQVHKSEARTTAIKKCSSYIKQLQQSKQELQQLHDELQITRLN